MRIERQVSGGRQFMEFELRGEKYELQRHGFVSRYKGRGYVQSQQATESPLIHDGSQTTLSTAADFRNSTLTGTTLSGPSGSGQFLAVVLSTTVDRTVQLNSTVTVSDFGKIYGICQNKPRPGDAVDVGLFGITKAVAGTTSWVRGSDLSVSSTAAGTLTVLSSGLMRVARALETPQAVGQVITVALYGFGGAVST